MPRAVSPGRRTLTSICLGRNQGVRPPVGDPILVGQLVGQARRARRDRAMLLSSDEAVAAGRARRGLEEHLTVALPVVGEIGRYGGDDHRVERRPAVAQLRDDLRRSGGRRTRVRRP